MLHNPVVQGAADAASFPVNFEPRTKTLQNDPIYSESPGKSHAGEVNKKTSTNGNTGGLPPVYSGQRIGGAKDFTQGGSGDGEGNPGNTGGGGSGGGGSGSGDSGSGGSGGNTSSDGRSSSGHPYRDISARKSSNQINGLMGSSAGPPEHGFFWSREGTQN